MPVPISPRHAILAFVAHKSFSPEADHQAGSRRKKLRRWETHLQPRFVTFSCFRRVPLLAQPVVRDRFVALLVTARERHGFRLIAWVVMPEHVHVIIVPTSGLGTGSKMPAILTGVKKPFAQEMLATWRTAGHPCLLEIKTSDGRERFWQAGGGFDRNVRDDAELARAIDYIHRNPVERGLVEHPTDWAWSSARRYAQIADGPTIDRSDGTPFPL